METEKIVLALNDIRDVLKEKLDEITSTLDEIRATISGEKAEE